MSQNLTIYSAGLSAQDNMALNTATKLLRYENIRYDVSKNEATKAHLLVIDEDSQQGKLVIRQSRPGQVKIVVSSNPKMAKNSIGLNRPIDLSVLKSVLIKLHAKLDSQLSAHHKTLINSPADSSITELKNSLLNALIETKDKKRVLHITTSSVPDIFIDGRNQCLATSSSESQIEQLIDTPINEISLIKLTPKSFAVHSNELNIQSLQNMLWLTGIKSSCGRILPGHSPDRPFRLKAWPNFTRNTYIPEHLKLAAILAKQPATISQLAKSTAIPINEVINFYNAAFAVDLIDFNISTSGENLEVRKQTAEQKGLFSRIAQRLQLKGIF